MEVVLTKTGVFRITRNYILFAMWCWPSEKAVNHLTCIKCVNARLCQKTKA